jgi:histidine triad (HIT) family protein
MAMADCIFCAIVAGEAPARVVHEDDRTLAFLDIAPIVRGHTLVIPKRHCRDLLDIRTEDMVAVALATRDVSRRVVTNLAADGINLIQATGEAALQTVFHFHFHVLPRFADDALPLPEQLVQRRLGEAAQLDALADRIGRVQR